MYEEEVCLDELYGNLEAEGSFNKGVTTGDERHGDEDLANPAQVATTDTDELYGDISDARAELPSAFSLTRSLQVPIHGGWKS